MFSLLRLVTIYALLILATCIGLMVGGLMFAGVSFWLPDSVIIKSVLFVLLAIVGGFATFKLHSSASTNLKERLLDPGSVFARSRIGLYGKFAAMAFSFCWAVAAVAELVGLSG